MKPRAKHIPRRPPDEPVYVNPTGMDFEKRRLVVTSVSGSTIKSMMPTISNALVTFDSRTVSHEGNTVYKL